MENTLIKLLGWRATILHGDPTVADRWDWVRRHLTPGPLRTLEAGCGTGAMTMFAAKIGNDAIGLSFNERNNRIAVQRARILKLSNVKFRTADLRNLAEISAELGTFDQILCLETIEHLLEDQKLVSNLSALLKPGGKLLLTTPFKGHNPLIGETTDREYRTNVEDGGHVRFGYTAEEIRALFETAGLKVSREDYVSGLISQTLYSVLCHLDQKIPHKFAWAMTLPLRPLRRFDSWVTRFSNYPGLSLAVVGIKKAA